VDGGKVRSIKAVSEYPIQENSASSKGNQSKEIGRRGSEAGKNKKREGKKKVKQGRRVRRNITLKVVGR